MSKSKLFIEMINELEEDAKYFDTINNFKVFLNDVDKNTGEKDHFLSRWTGRLNKSIENLRVKLIPRLAKKLNDIKFYLDPNPKEYAFVFPTAGYIIMAKVTPNKYGNIHDMFLLTALSGDMEIRRNPTKVVMEWYASMYGVTLSEKSYYLMEVNERKEVTQFEGDNNFQRDQLRIVTME